jgi:Ser/Thr protein kinase RdoA (MazF antagonist)
LVATHAPGAELIALRELGADTVTEGATLKAVGYGRPLRLDVRLATGERVKWVLHTATPNAFGHDRRADRVAEMLLAYDTFREIPSHTRALDVGLVANDGALISLRDTSEAYLVTTWAEGHIYADELRAISERGHATARDVAHARRLGAFLADLHEPIEHPHSYVRSVRDLVGGGEGIFGIIDGYPADVPSAPPERLQAIERLCVAWRWRLKPRRERLVRIHGDFHPFNLLFDDDSELALLDASRGCAGDAADDLTALCINYLFFALQAETWTESYRPLWRAFFDAYLTKRNDDEVIALAPPYLAWRALVLSNPAWYPDLDPRVRDELLGLAEQALTADRFSLEHAEDLFT